VSSEEMRVELEAFVNMGLREGWGGWPLKEETRASWTSGVLRAGPIRFCRRQGNAGTASYGRLQAFRAGGRYSVEN